MKKLYVFSALFVLFVWLTTGCGGENSDDGNSGDGNNGNNGAQMSEPVSFSIFPTTETIVPGRSVTLTVTAISTGIRWPESVDGSYIIRSDNTVVYTPPSAAGIYKFTVTTSADPARTTTATITVEQPEPAIAVFPKTATLRVGMDMLFIADVHPEQTVYWHVSDNCGTIAPNGKFNAQEAGTCVVTASVSGNNGLDMSADAEIRVLAGAVDTGTVSVAALAESLDLPAYEFAQCYESEAGDAVIASKNEGSSIFDVKGVPANVLLNRKTGVDRFISGVRTIDWFESELAALLAGSGNTPISVADVEKTLEDAFYYGNPDAEIVALVYSDLLCPYCKRHYNNQTLETLAANHPAEVVMVLKNYPLESHPTADLGAAGLYCAGRLGGDDVYYSYLAQAIRAGKFTD